MVATLRGPPPSSPARGRRVLASAALRLLHPRWAPPPPALCARLPHWPAQVWGRGRVALLGDAAHLSTQLLAQGTSQAFEDALELGRAVGELWAGLDQAWMDGVRAPPAAACDPDPPAEQDPPANLLPHPHAALHCPQARTAPPQRP